MSLPETARQVFDGFVGPGAAGARATKREVPITDRVAELLGEQREARKRRDRAGVIHAVTRRPAGMEVRQRGG